MPWYTVSIIISCRLKHGYQKVYPVYENFTLFEAENRSDAIEKAELYGKRYAEVDDQLRLNGEEAYWKFEGIRKLIEVRDYFSDELDIDGPRSGVELSYSYMEVNSEEKIFALATGKAVNVRYVDMDDDGLQSC